MHKKFISLLTVTAVIFACIIPLDILACENVIFADDFESYSENVTGGWRVQPSGTVAAENTSKGKSAKIVSTDSSRCELIREFTKTSADVRCVVFSFSIYLCDNSASRTLLSRSEETGELFLMTFNMGKNTVSINGREVPETDFSYGTEIWYNVRFSYNLNNGVIKVELTDDSGEKTVLFGSGIAGITGIERINFASFASSARQAVCYADDVSVCAGEPFERPFGFNVINENFDSCGEGKGIYGFDCDIMSNICENPFNTVITDRGKSACVTVCGGSSIRRSAAYLKGEKNIYFKAALKSRGDVNVSFYIDGVTIAGADFKNKQIAAGADTAAADIKQNEWVELEGEINTEQGIISLNVTQGGKTEGVLSDYGFGSFEPSKFIITVNSETESTVLLDNIVLEGFVFEKNVKPPTEIPVISDKTEEEIYKADFTSYTGGIPAGWGFQNYFNEASLAPGEGCMKISGGGRGCRLSKSFKKEDAQRMECLRFEFNFKFEDVSCERYIALNGDDGTDLYFIEFLKDSNRIKFFGKNIPESLFTYNADTQYIVTGEYNIKTGGAKAVISHDGVSDTVDGSADAAQQIRSVIFGVSGSRSDSSTLLYGASFYNVSQLIKEEKINRLNADDFEYYNNGVPSRFTGTFTGGGRVCAKDGTYGICAALMSKLGGSCTLSKKAEGISGNAFYTGISVYSPDGYSDGALYVRVNDGDGSNPRDISLVSFSADGIKIGNAATGLAFNKETWYNADILCDTLHGTVKATVNGNEFNVNLSDLRGNVSSYYIKSVGRTLEESAFYIDNAAFCGGGFYGIENAASLRNLSADEQSFTLNFTEPVSGCRVLINGADSLVRDVSSNGCKVTVSLKPLEKNKKYAFSFSNAEDSHGNIYSGNFRFTVSGSDVKIVSSAIKNENGTNYISNGRLTAYATLKSETEKEVLVYICVYDREKERLLAIKTKSVFAGADGTDIEEVINIPGNCHDYYIGYYIWDKETISPIKENNDLLPYNIPNGETIIRQIDEKTDRVHPRLLANKNDFNRIRAEISSGGAAAGDYFNLIDSANDIMRKPLTKYIMSGVTMTTSGALLSRIKTLAMAYRISGSGAYAERVYRELENAALNFGDWNSQHFLDTSNIIMAFAIGYDWIYDYISSDASRKAIIVNAMKNTGFNAVLDDYLDRDRYRTNRWLYISTPDNWNIYCNSAALTAAMAFSDDLPQECAMIFDYGFKYIQTAMRQFGPDGGWFEGVGYWDYLMNPLVILLGSMEKAIGSFYGLTNAEGFGNTAYYLIAMTGSSDRIFNFHNCLDERIYAGELFYLARLYGDKNIYAFINGFLKRNRTAVPFQALLWNDYEDDGKYRNMPLDFIFRGTEVCSMRSGWGQNDTFVALHAGKNALVHGHSDVGEFVLDMQGERFAMALGKDNYELVTPIWHGLYRERAEGHNTIVLNPGAYPDQSKTSDALIDRFESHRGEAFAVTDMTTAYKDNARFAIRGVKLTDNRRVVIVRDEIECFEGSDIWWFMHTDANISLSDDGKTAVLEKNNKKIKMSILGSNDLKFEIKDAAPFPSTPLPTNGTQNPNTGIKKLAIHIIGAEKADITVAASPENYTLKESYLENINKW